MNLGRSLSLLIVLSILLIFLFGYYLESNSIRHIYPSLFLTYRDLDLPRSAINGSSDAFNTKILIRGQSHQSLNGVFGGGKPSYSSETSEKVVHHDGDAGVMTLDEGTESSEASVHKEPSGAISDRETPVGREALVDRKVDRKEDPVDREKSVDTEAWKRKQIPQIPQKLKSSGLTVEKNANFHRLPEPDSISARIQRKQQNGSTSEAFADGIDEEGSVEDNVVFHHLPAPGDRFRASIEQKKQLKATSDKEISRRIEAARTRHMQGIYIRSTRLEKQGPRNWRKLPPKLYQLAPVIFDSVPRKFLPEYKNPCWYGSNQQLLCLPYFYVLGFPKAGTTDLWDKINNHPEVVRTFAKETHFWRDHQIGSSLAFQKYLANALLLTNRLKLGDARAVSGDGSATTVISHNRYVKFFPNMTAEFYTNVDIIKELTPKAKMIIAIREPVERLYSGYLYHPIRIKRTVEHFHKEAYYYVKMFEKCLAQKTELQCVFEKVTAETRAQRLKAGLYAPYIKSWVDGFGFDQIKVIRLEDWRDNCTGILPEIFKFLDLAPRTSLEMKRLCMSRTANQNKVYIGPMLDSTRQMLQTFYEPFNKQLNDLLNATVYPPYR